MPAIASPLPQFFDLSGDPLEAGYVHIGAAGGNPETAPVPVYWDADLTQPAVQPLRTSRGYIARGGTPAAAYVASSYSLTAKRSNGVRVLYAPTSDQTDGASALRSDLASEVAGKGSDLVAFKVSEVADAAARTVQDRLRETLCVTDFDGVDPTGVGDSTTGIVAAIAAAATYPVRDLWFPSGNYRVTATLTLPSDAGANFTLIGYGNASYGSVLSGVLITADHTAGPAIHMQSSGQRLENLVITASAARTAGARGSNFGVLMEAPDTVSGSINGASLRNVTIANHPFHGLVTSGKLFMCRFDGLAVQNNKGHGAIIDCGAVTDRTNKGLPGGLVFNQLRAYGNTGHTFVCGLGNGTATSASSFSATIGASSFGAYRITIIDADLDCGGAVLDGTLGYGFNAGYNAVIKGDSISLQNVAFGGAQSGSPALVCQWLSGWAHKQQNCRYIQSTGVARIKATPSYDAYDFRFENPYLDVAVAVGIAGEDTGGAVARQVVWLGDKSMVTTVASTFDQVVDGDVYGNVYTPTLTNTTNIDASTAYVCQYARVGSVVTVSGRVDIDATATTTTVLNMSLPVASDISDSVQVAGTFNGLGGDEPGVIYGTAASDTATFQYVALGTGNRTFYFHFTYRIR